MAMVYTVQPTSQKYTILAEKIVNEFPLLTDVYGFGFVRNSELPARASEQGNVIGLVSVYMYVRSCHKKKL